MTNQYPALAEFRRIAEANRAAGNIPAKSKPKPQPSFYSKKPQEHPTNWSDLRVELLKQLAAGHFSAGQIALRLGEVTRNAVIGKCSRLGITLTGRPARIEKPKPNKSEAICVPPAPRPRKPAQILVPVLTVPDLEPAPEGAITLANINELTETMCHWPLGDPQENGFHYCARRKSRDASFCEHHMAIAYRPRSRKPKPKGKNGFHWLDLAGRNARGAAQ